MTTHDQRPAVLVLAGHDPTGGAGMQADIETLHSHGCQAACVITALTAQNTHRVAHVRPQSQADFAEQLALLAEDMNFNACKIGVCPDPDLIVHIAAFLRQQPELPVVLDPVLIAGCGDNFLDTEMHHYLREQLLPLARIITPNAQEARQLSGRIDLAEAAAELLAAGAHSVLITGGDEPTQNNQQESVQNVFYQHQTTPMSYRYTRLPGRFHGSGCTLSAAIAANLALGRSLPVAVAQAQDYTWRCLEAAQAYGSEQLHPCRIAATDR
ncbi:MAG: hydroxymethylpyrimidine/phosphomethylpyrimidine kinase [Gammaproteobacteria bacterium]